MNTKTICRLILLASCLFFVMVGTASAADDDSFSLNIKDQLDDYVNQLPDDWQDPISWLLDNLFLIVVIGTVGLIWYHSIMSNESKRSGSVSGQAQAERAQERIAKRFGMAILLSAVVLTFAGLFLI